MSILETFYILFKSDASEVKKGADQAEQSTKHLQDSLKGVNEVSDKVGHSFLEMSKSFASVVSAVASVSSIIAGVRAATNYTQELGQVSRQLQVNVSDLDAWGNAVERAGGTASAFQGSLKSLSERFGITGQRALDLLPKFAESFSKLNQTQALRYGKNILGLDEATILLLQHGRREVEAVIQRQKELGTVNLQDAENVKKFNESLHDAAVTSRTFFRELMSPAIPYFTKFIDYFIEHKDLVVGAFGAMTIAAIGLTIALAPISFITAAIAAGVGVLIGVIALLYEDIQFFRRGQESFIGSVLKRWPLVGTVIKTVFQGISEYIHALFNPLETLQKLLNGVWRLIIGIFGHGKELTVNINDGKNQIAGAGASSIRSFYGSQSSNSRNNSVTTGPITINTQATDSNGVANSLKGELNTQLAQVNSHFDDGVLY